MNTSFQTYIYTINLNSYTRLFNLYNNSNYQFVSYIHYIIYHLSFIIYHLSFEYFGFRIFMGVFCVPENNQKKMF